MVPKFDRPFEDFTFGSFPSVDFFNMHIRYEKPKHLGDIKCPELFKYKLKLTKDCVCESLNPNKGIIPKGTILESTTLMQNLYGVHVEVKYEGYNYSLNPRNVELIPKILDLEFGGKLIFIDNYVEEINPELEKIYETLFVEDSIGFSLDFDLSKKTLKLIMGDSWNNIEITFVESFIKYELDDKRPPIINITNCKGFLEDHESYPLPDKYFYQAMDIWSHILSSLDNGNKQDLEVIFEFLHYRNSGKVKIDMLNKKNNRNYRSRK